MSVYKHSMGKCKQLYGNCAVAICNNKDFKSQPRENVGTEISGKYLKQTVQRWFKPGSQSESLKTDAVRYVRRRR